MERDTIGWVINTDMKFEDVVVTKFTLISGDHEIEKVSQIDPLKIPAIDTLVGLKPILQLKERANNEAGLIDSALSGKWWVTEIPRQLR